MVRTVGLGYAKGSLILITILLAIFAFWRFSGKSLSVENFRSFKAELFYWVAILFSNTLGTAFGDSLADNSDLGFAGESFLIGELKRWWSSLHLMQEFLESSWSEFRFFNSPFWRNIRGLSDQTN